MNTETIRLHAEEIAQHIDFQEPQESTERREFITACYHATDVLRELWNPEQRKVKIPTGFLRNGRFKPVEKSDISELSKRMRGLFVAGELATIIEPIPPEEVEKWKDDAGVSIAKAILGRMGFSDEERKRMYLALVEAVGKDKAITYMQVAGIEGEPIVAKIPTRIKASNRVVNRVVNKDVIRILYGYANGAKRITNTEEVCEDATKLCRERRINLNRRIKYNQTETAIRNGIILLAFGLMGIQTTLITLDSKSYLRVRGIAGPSITETNFATILFMITTGLISLSILYLSHQTKERIDDLERLKV